MFEHYRNTAARVAHNASPHRNTFFGIVRPMFAAAPVQTVVTRVDPADDAMDSNAN
jgi:quinol monooxygenase YgiN